jgi:hypothetical protein
VNTVSGLRAHIFLPISVEVFLPDNKENISLVRKLHIMKAYRGLAAIGGCLRLREITLVPMDGMYVGPAEPFSK